MNTYEIMFLFDPAFAANQEAVETEINRLMQRAEAEVILIKRLEERRLHYEIKGRRRGLYALTYFKVDGQNIPRLERDLRISETVLRALILRADHMSREKMESAALGAAHDPRRRGEHDAHAGGPPTRHAPPRKEAASPPADPQGDEQQPALVGSTAKQDDSAAEQQPFEPHTQSPD